MQKQYRLGIPSFITVETEDGSWIGEKDAQKTEKDDVVVTYETTPEAEEVWLTADQTKVKRSNSAGTPRSIRNRGSLAVPGREHTGMWTGKVSAAAVLCRGIFWQRSEKL